MRSKRRNSDVFMVGLAVKLGLLLAVPAAAIDTVELANGDVLSGTIVSSGADGIVLDHPVLGRLELDEAVLAVRVDRAATAPPPGRLARARRWLGDPTGWTRSIEIGVSGSEGNTDVLDFVGGLQLEHENESRRWNFNSRFFHSTSNNATSKSQGRAELSRDWLFPGRRLFAYSEARYDYDRFEAWDHRLSIGGGPGFEWLDTPRWTLRTRSGVFVTRTFGAPGRDEINPEGSLGFTLAWRPNERSSFELSNTVRANLRDTGEFRNLTRAGWKIDLSDEGGLAFKLGVENEWESDVDEGNDENDLKYYGSLVVDF